jgi:hypothetical protein
MGRKADRGGATEGTDMKRSKRPAGGSATRVHPVPGSRNEQTVKRVDDRHPYGSVRPTDKRAEHYEEQERTPKPPVESPAGGPATRRRAKREA